METNIQTDNEIEIDIGEVFAYLLGRAGYILFTGIVFAVVTFAITTFLISPKYTSTTKMYVLNRQTNESITNSDLQSSTYLTKDYMEMIKSRTVIETVIAEMGLEMTYEEVFASMSVTTTSDTRVVAISVTNGDPYLARDIANEIRIAAASHIQAVMNTEAVNVVDEANIPSQKSSPKMRNHLLFLHDPRVPSDNNAAERRLRNYKRKQKQAMSFRSMENHDYLCRGMSMLVVMRENNINLFDRVSRILD